MDVLNTGRNIGNADSSVGKMLSGVKWSRAFFYANILLCFILVLFAVGLGAPNWFASAAAMAILIILGWRETDSSLDGKFSFLFYMLLFLAAVLMVVPGTRADWTLPLYLAGAVRIFA